MQIETPPVVAGSRRRLALSVIVSLLLASTVWFFWPTGDAAEGIATSADESQQVGVAVPGTLGGDSATSQEVVVGQRADVEEPARVAVVSCSSLSGCFRVPNGPWPGEGNLALVKAATVEAKGAMQMFSVGMEVARRDAKFRAAEAAGEGTGGRREMESSFGEMIGRTAPVRMEPIDPLGNFVIESPPVGRYQVVLDHPLLQNLEPLVIDIEADTKTDLGEIATRWAASLLVLVSDAEGQPVVGAKLELGRQIDVGEFMTPEGISKIGGMFQRIIPYTGVTDERGARQFRGLPVDPTWLLEVSASGCVREHQSFRLLPGRSRVLHITMLRGAAMDVIVHNPDGTPYAGARVSLSFPEVTLPPRVIGMKSEERSYSHSMRTGADGVGHAVGLPTGPVIVSAEPAGYFRVEQRTTITDDGVVRVQLALDQGETIRGRILDTDGLPVAHARVMATEVPEGLFAGFGLQDVQDDVAGLRMYKDGVEVAENGEFVLGGFEPGVHLRVYAVAPGYDRGQVDDVVVGTEDIEIRLSELARLTGRVVSSPAGEPVTAFEARLERKVFLMFDNAMVRETFTEREDGDFTLTDVPRGQFKLVIDAPGRAVWTKRLDFAAGAVDVGEIELLLPASVRGVVTDSDGQPVAGATIRIAKGGMTDALIMAQMLGTDLVESDADGRFEVTNLTGKRVRFIVDKEGYATMRSAPIPLEVGKSREGIVLQLDRGGVLLGRLIDEDGKPLVGWRAQSSHTSGRSVRYAETDASGEFVLDGLMAGSHKVDCMPSDYLSQFTRPSSQERSAKRPGFNLGDMVGKMMRMIVSSRVMIRTGETTELELIYDKGEVDAGDELASLVGTVTVGDEPMVSGVVFVAPAGSSTPGEVAVVADGRFSLAGLTLGKYRCQARFDVLGAAVGTSQIVDLPTASEHRVALTLPGGRLSGRVVGVDGEPVAGVALSLTGNQSIAVVDRMDYGEGTSLTDSKGAFRFEGLAAGQFGLVAKELFSGGQRTARLSDVRLGGGEHRTDLVLTLDGGGGLKVTVRDVRGARRNAMVTLLDVHGNVFGLFHRSLTDMHGVVEFSNLPTGEYRVSVAAPGLASQASSSIAVSGDIEQEYVADLVAGEPVSLDFVGELKVGFGPEVVLYSVRAEDGALLETGQVAVPRITSEMVAQRSPVSLGRYAPGRYRIRIESPRIGARSARGVVKTGKPAVWHVSID